MAESDNNSSAKQSNGPAKQGLEGVGYADLDPARGETVVIGNDVTVTVLGVKGNQVRLGVNAPREVAVHREEIFERIKREQTEEKPRPALNGSTVHP